MVPALGQTDSLEKELLSANDKEKLRLFNKLSKAYREYSIDKSLEYGEKNLALAEQLESEVDIINALENISWVYHRKQNPGMVEKCDIRAMNLARKNERWNDVSYFANDLGLTYYGMADYAKAVEYYQISLDAAVRADNLSSQAKIYNNLGSISFNKGDYYKALDNFIRALKIKEEIGNQKDIANCYLNIGSVYLQTAQKSKALKYYNDALHIYEKARDSVGMALAMNNVGSILEQLGKYEEALSFHNRSLVIKRKLGDIKGISTSYNNLGNLYLRKREYRKALEYFQKSKDLKNTLDDRYGVMLVDLSIGKVYHRTGNTAGALACYNESLSLAEEIKSTNYIAEAHKELAAVYAGMGNYRMAYQHDTTARVLIDTVFSDKIADMQAKYEVDKTEKENEVLRQNNRINELKITEQKGFQKMTILVTFFVVTVCLFIALLFYNRYRSNKKLNKTLSETNTKILSQNEELEKILRKLTESETKLREANATKDKFFSIIAHDLRNPFNSIMGLSGLLKDEWGHLSEDNKKKFISNIRLSSENVYRLLENLLQWSRAQVGTMEYNPVNFRLAEVVDENICLLQSQAGRKNISLASTVPALLEVHSSVNMLTTVLRNLLSNAVKFTPEGGLVKISSHARDGMVEVAVEDNGIGISPEDVEKLFRPDQNFRRKGTNNEDGTGLGLILCKEFVEKNGGQIRVESEPDKGSRFIFTVQPKKVEQPQYTE
jgi:signal transduction histidine kinase/uncharacterized protein HemY